MIHRRLGRKPGNCGGGGDEPAIIFLGALAVAFALYVVALALIRARASRVTLVFAVAAVIQLTPLAGPLLLSRDVYSYWAYGRIAGTHDRDPYVVTPAS